MQVTSYEVLPIGPSHRNSCATMGGDDLDSGNGSVFDLDLEEGDMCSPVLSIISSVLLAIRSI